MPRIECDKSLQDRLALVVKEIGNTSATAVQLGLSRTLVWRFHNTGRAILKSRQKLELALNAWAARTGKKVKSEIKSETNDSLFQLANISVEEFNAMRKHLQNMVALMDFYEKNELYHSSQKNGASSTGKEK